MKKIIAISCMLFVTIIGNNVISINAQSTNDYTHNQEVTKLELAYDDSYYTGDSSSTSEEDNEQKEEAKKQRMNSVFKVILTITIVWFFICLAFKVFFMLRKKKIIETVEFKAPDNMDPLAVGYYIDGSIDNEDIVGMLLYFSKKGYLKIENQCGELLLIKNNEISIDEPEYAKKLFDMLFPYETTIVNVQDIGLILSNNKNFIIDAINELEQGQTLLSKSSRIIRAICMLTTIIVFGLITLSFIWMPFIFIILIICFVGLFQTTIVLSKTKRSDGFLKIVDNILLFSGGVLVFSVTIGLIAAYKEINIVTVVSSGVLLSLSLLIATSIKEVNTDYIQLIGKLRGFKNFLTTVEMDKFNKLVEEDPSYFADVLPYIYSFGLTDKFIANTNYLQIELKEWKAYLNEEAFGNIKLFTQLTSNIIDETLKMNGLKK